MPQSILLISLIIEWIIQNVIILIYYTTPAVIYSAQVVWDIQQ